MEPHVFKEELSLCHRRSFKRNASEGENPPLYAKVNKPRRKSRNRDHDKENKMAAQPGDSSRQNKVEYTEVYISGEDSKVQVRLVGHCVPAHIN